jgi:CIC family chloride channel protein
VLGEGDKVVGIVLSDVLRTMAANPEISPFTIAHDLMVPPVSVQDTDNLQRALEIILEHGLREIVVVDSNDRIVGFLDEAEITRAYHSTTVSRRD